MNAELGTQLSDGLFPEQGHFCLKCRCVVSSLGHCARLSVRCIYHTCPNFGEYLSLDNTIVKVHPDGTGSLKNWSCSPSENREALFGTRTGTRNSTITHIPSSTPLDRKGVKQVGQNEESVDFFFNNFRLLMNKWCRRTRVPPTAPLKNPNKSRKALKALRDLCFSGMANLMTCRKVHTQRAQMTVFPTVPTPKRYHGVLNTVSRKTFATKGLQPCP